MTFTDEKVRYSPVCPACGGRNSEVIDTRPSPYNETRRRRHCNVCLHNFTTYEYVVLPQPGKQKVKRG